MGKEAVFRIGLESGLCADFMTETEAVHRSASQITREPVRKFVERQRETREYDEFLRRKVDAGRASMHAEVGHSNDLVEAMFAARRARGTREV